MVEIKKIYSDFVVDEIPTWDLDKLDQNKGKFLILKLIKKDWNTISAINEVAKFLKTSSNNIGFAGTKDRHAITSQYISVKNISNQKLIELKNDKSLQVKEGILIEYVGFNDVPLSLGDLNGNKFKIVVRDMVERGSLSLRKYFINYFDEQRFSEQNVQIGKAIIKKNFKEAVFLIKNSKVLDALKLNPTDYLAALLKLPKKLLLLYVHAYQSYLWNETVTRYFKKNYNGLKTITYSQGELVIAADNLFSDILDLEIPIIGALPFDSSVSIELKKLMGDLMLEEDIDRFNFVIKQIPNMTQEGGKRKVVVELNDLNMSSVEDDDIFLGKKKQTVSFALGKGSYATMAIRFMLENQ